MEKEPTKAEVDQRAREVARRLMSMPPQRQEWPKKPKPKRPDREPVEQKPTDQK